MKEKLFFTIAFSIVSIFAAQATLAQFPIRIPKIPKIDIKKKKEAEKKVEEAKKPQPAETRNEESSVKSEPEKVAPKPTENQLGTIYFSNKPFPAGGGTEGSKTSFTSSEFIYGRLVLKSGTIGEVMKPSPPKDKYPNHHLDFYFYKIGESNFSPHKFRMFQDFSAIVLSESDLGKNYLDFDVLPDPNNFSTRFFPYSQYAYETYFAGAIYSNLIRVNKIVEGKNEIYLDITGNLLDFRGDKANESQWKIVTSKFNFEFRGSDYQSLKSNYELMNKNVEQVKVADQPLPNEWTLKSNPIAGGFTEARLRTMYGGSSGGQSLKIIKFYADPFKENSYKIIRKS